MILKNTDNSSSDEKFIFKETSYIKLFPSDFLRSEKLDSMFTWAINRMEGSHDFSKNFKLLDQIEALNETISLDDLKLLLNKKKNFNFDYSPVNNDIFQLKIKTKEGYLDHTLCYFNNNWHFVEFKSCDFLLETIQTGVIRIIKRKRIEFKK